MATIKTAWEARTYDVWGNEDDGFDVNDTADIWTVNLDVYVEVNNPGTDREFRSAHLTDQCIQEVFGCPEEIEIDGDDTHYEVTRVRDGYPIGNLFCESHESLSPIRARDLDDSDLIDAIQPLYQLAWADIAEEHGESFSGCELTEVCPEGNPDALLPIAKEWASILESTYGKIADLFSWMGVDESEWSLALYYVFMEHVGHGVGFSDFAYSRHIDHDPFAPHQVNFDDSPVREIAESDYYRENPDHKPSDWIED